MQDNLLINPAKSVLETSLAEGKKIDLENVYSRDSYTILNLKLWLLKGQIEALSFWLKLT